MKASKYNIYVKKKHGVICFNTFHDIYSFMSAELYELIQAEEYDKISDRQKKYLFKSGFLIEQDDELALLKNEHSKAVGINGTYELTLLPSLDCNLRCWYCFEKHIKNSHLNVITQNLILNYVDSILCRDDIKFLNLELFGGEPLLYFKKELYPLLKQIKCKAEEHNKGVHFFFVTNATCIHSEHLSLFEDLHASFQISIDGYKEKHNSIKRYFNTSEGTYDKVIEVIHQLANNYDTYINLRINYDNDTLNHIEEVIKDIIDIDRRKIGIHMERVWQTSPEKEVSYKIKDVLNLFMVNGFAVSYMNLARRSYSCKSGKVDQAIISYNGDVYKCSGRDFTNELREGVLQDNGCIKWNNLKLEKRLSQTTYDNEYCISCKLLPLCWGPCNQKLLETPGNILRYCQLRNMELSLDEYVEYRFNNELLKMNMYESTP